jgi:hypothetical protein
MMTPEEIQHAVEGVMAIRPEGSGVQRERKSPVTAKRMTDMEFQLEMAAIMRDEIPNGSAYFFNRTEPAKGGNRI